MEVIRVHAEQSWRAAEHVALAIEALDGWCEHVATQCTWMSPSACAAAHAIVDSALQWRSALIDHADVLSAQASRCEAAAAGAAERFALASLLPPPNASAFF